MVRRCSIFLRQDGIGSFPFAALESSAVMLEDQFAETTANHDLSLMYLSAIYSHYAIRADFEAFKSINFPFHRNNFTNINDWNFVCVRTNCRNV